jgi:phosphatidate cytidylyltransferase
MQEDVWQAHARKSASLQTISTWIKSLSQRATPDWLQSLGKRLITAFIAMPIVIVILWMGGWYAFGGAVTILGLGIYELKSMFEKLGYRPLTILSFIYGLFLFLGAMIPTTFFSFTRQTVMEVTITTLVLGSLSWLLIMRPKLGNALLDWALTLVMTLYLAWPLSYLLTLRGMELGPNSPRFWWTIVVFLGIWSFDSAAYFSGRFFGRHHLAPTISPSKTWEGVVGGTLLTIVSVWVFTLPIKPSVAWYHILFLSLLISFAATIGDLAESLIKRQTDVKDSGNFFWGHGGVLDRIDSLLFASVVVYFYITLALHSF